MHTKGGAAKKGTSCGAGAHSLCSPLQRATDGPCACLPGAPGAGRGRGGGAQACCPLLDTWPRAGRLVVGVVCFACSPPHTHFPASSGKAYVVREQHEVKVHNKDNTLIATLSVGKKDDKPGFDCQWCTVQNMPFKKMLDSPPDSWEPNSKLAKVPGANLTLHRSDKGIWSCPNKYVTALINNGLISLTEVEATEEAAVAKE